MRWQFGKQILTMHILPNISKSKRNQIMKFGQLIEYNMTNIFFFEKSFIKCVGESNPRPFSKNQNWAFALDQ